MIKIITPLLLMLTIVSAHAKDAQQLETEVNAYWVNSNYVGIISTIDDELRSNPHNLFALSLRHGYYVNIENNYEKSKESSARFVAEVDRRVPQARSAVYDLAKKIADSSASQSEHLRSTIGPEQLAELHKSWPNTFPSMERYRWFCDNLDRFAKRK